MSKSKPPVTFNVKLIGGEVKTIAADKNEVLSSAVSANGVNPVTNDHFVFYHRNSIVSPYYSIGRLDINDGDTLVLVEPKKVPKPKRSLQYSKSIDNLRALADIDNDFVPNAGTDDFYLFKPSKSNPSFQTERYPTVIPKPARTISRDPLPMSFGHSEVENNDFWDSINVKYSHF